MQVSLNWLKEYVPVSLPVSKIAEALTMTGFEVERVFDRYAYLEGVVVGRVIGVTAHPDADHLKVCRVNAGDRDVSVVCGAPNVREKMLSALVVPGVVLPGGVTVRKSKIRGFLSEGMLGSAAELGIGNDGAGILEIDGAVTPGTPLVEALSLSDPVLEIKMTPNRPDCLSMIGMAREVAGFSGEKLTLPRIQVTEERNNISEYTAVTIEDPELCSRYVARVVLDVKVQPSPFWLRDRLLSVGLKPINNIVDITNFVMMETGQPLHAFDLDRLAENRIVVRRAGDASLFTTLDQKERRLAPDMLMICDAEKPVAVAGVMGGLNSEIGEQTTRVLIESACFKPASIRKTSKTLGMSSDASYRFERGVDPLGTALAADRAAQLMEELAEGIIVRGMIDNHPRPAAKKTITVSAGAVNRRLGTSLSVDDMAGLLAPAAFNVHRTVDDTFEVEVPSFRVDVDRPEDISEEVARLWGYDNIPVTFPVIRYEGGESPLTVDRKKRLKELMTGFGFSEIVSYSFISENACAGIDFFRTGGRLEPVRVLNPLAADQSVMRMSLVPGLLITMGHNLSQQIYDMKIFESGRVFWKNSEGDMLPEEPEMIAALVTGAARRQSWQTPEELSGFFDIKGALEWLLKEMGVKDCKFTAMPRERCKVTRAGYTAQVSVRGVDVGVAGEISPDIMEKFDLKKTAFVFELNVSALMPLLSDHLEARPLSRFPSVSRDITVIVNGDAEAERVLNFLEEGEDDLIEEVQVVAVYEGGAIPAGQKSLSARIVYRSHEGTLKDEFVNRIHAKIAERLVKRFAAGLPA